MPRASFLRVKRSSCHLPLVAWRARFGKRRATSIRLCAPERRATAAAAVATGHISRLRVGGPRLSLRDATRKLADASVCSCQFSLRKQLERRNTPKTARERATRPLVGLITARRLREVPNGSQAAICQQAAPAVGQLSGGQLSGGQLSGGQPLARFKLCAGRAQIGVFSPSATRDAAASCATRCVTLYEFALKRPTT